MSARIAHVLFVDIVGWSKGSLEEQSGSVDRLNRVAHASTTFISEKAQDRLALVAAGDGFAALFFGDLAAAAQCALEIAASTDIPIRMGIHSGPVQTQDDIGGKVNFVGDGINMAKRTLDFAEPGKIVLSAAYAEWLSQSDAWKLRIHELGTGEAKHGVKIRLFELKKPVLAQSVKRFVILYKRKAEPDETLLALLESELKDRGHDVFIDRHLKIGVDWARSIEERIREADGAIILVSESAENSEMLEAEVEIAASGRQERGNPLLLPVRIGTDAPIEGGLKPLLAGLHFGSWHSSANSEELLQHILRSLEQPAEQKRVQLVESDTGGLSPESPLYIERSADEPFHVALRNVESILLVKGPRQMGKTSLLARGVRTAGQMQARTVFTDLQKFSGAHINDENAFYRAVAAFMAKSLGFAYDFHGEWDPIFGAGMNMESFIRALLESDSRPLLWFMDEADKMFTAPYASDFYGLVRSWHNSRATDPSGPWRKMSVVIAYATEAHLFIQDLNQSPFNVGRRFDLYEFTLDQITDLNSRAGGLLPTSSEISELQRLVGGQPFLVRRAMNALASGMTFEELLANASRDDGPFGDHLKRILVSVSKLEPVLQTVIAVLEGRPASDPESLGRLSASGVIVEPTQGPPKLRNELYRAFLTRTLLGR